MALRFCLAIQIRHRVLPARPAGVATDAVCYNTAMLAYQILALQGLLGLAWMVLRAATLFEGQCLGACFWLLCSWTVFKHWMDSCARCTRAL